MPKKLTSVLGIDIGSQKIKVAELRSQGKDPAVTALGMAATPEGAVDHTGIFNPDAVAATLKQLLAESGTSVGAAVVSIAGQASVLVRTVEVPRMNPAELKQHMEWEINRNIPFAESTVCSDFRALPDEDPNSANMDVVMAISPQSAIDTIVQAVKKAGKTVAAIDVEPLALARALDFNYADELGNETVCVVEMGHKTTAINIYRNAKLLLPRQIPIGGEMFTRAIADSMGISATEADDLKRESAVIPETAGATPTFATFGDPGATTEFQPYNPFSDDAATPGPAIQSVAPPTFDEPVGVPAEEPVAPVEPTTAMAPAAPAADDRMYNAIAPVLDEFGSEVRRSIDYFRSRGGDISRILVSGGGTRIKGLKEYLARTLGVACDEFDPTRRLNVNVRKVAPGFVEEHRSEFAVAIGNGLYIFFD